MDDLLLKIQEKMARFGGKKIFLDPEFYSFLRRLQTYEKLAEGKTTILLEGDSELLRYFRSPRISGK